MIQQKEEIFLSAISLNGSQYTQLTGMEAKQWMDAHGYSFVHVDDEGIIHALSPKREVLEGFRLYRRFVGTFM